MALREKVVVTELPPMTMAEFRDAARPAVEEIIDAKPTSSGGTKIDLSDVSLSTDATRFFLEEERRGEPGSLGDLTKAEFRQLVNNAIVALFADLPRLGGGVIDLAGVRLKYHTNRSLLIETGIVVETP